MRELVTIRTIRELTPIPGADAIETAKIDGWEAVVRKGEFVAGEDVIFFEVDSFLPVHPEFEFLRPSSYRKLQDGREGFRLKTIKLKGQISQGLVVKASLLCDIGSPFYEGGPPLTHTTPFSEYFGVTLWEPYMPLELKGHALGAFPSFIPKTDEERIQNLPPLQPGLYNVTEKLDGMSVTFFRKDGVDRVCTRNWEVKPEGHLGDILNTLNLQEGLAYQGELIGPKIQGNRYQLTYPRVFVFTVYDFVNGCRREDYRELAQLAGLIQVPDLGCREFTTNEQVIAMADGVSILHNTSREGIVVRKKDDPSVSFKSISRNFLLKNDV